ncbi:MULTISPECIES: DUF2946 family protein [unclassified Bradyrhizobium]|uniref:DUF2946 family protein n=1 Tax=unclassified Bradyrhizobium TaxID=2631580 RepID=UPI002915E7D7|nr:MULTISPECIES: DUF2946 family protein [unclassified Bradyrhizobium]
MRQRLQAYVPILLIALTVQILAPIGASWAAAIAVSDPLRSVEICHSAPAGSPSQQDDSTGQGVHDACTLCCVGQAAAALDTPQPMLLDLPCRPAASVTWYRPALVLAVLRAGSNTQARAPPSAI